MGRTEWQKKAQAYGDRQGRGAGGAQTSLPATWCLRLASPPAPVGVLRGLRVEMAVCTALPFDRLPLNGQHPGDPQVSSFIEACGDIYYSATGRFLH